MSIEKELSTQQLDGLVIPTRLLCVDKGVGNPTRLRRDDCGWETPDNFYLIAIYILMYILLCTRIVCKGLSAYSIFVFCYLIP